MRALRQFGVLVLLLATCVAPTMACMVPGARMNAQERACCRTMGSQCGQAQRMASHRCCRKTQATLYNQARDAKAVTIHPIVVPATWLAASDVANPLATVMAWAERPDYSPPTSPPSTVSILRI